MFLPTPAIMGAVIMVAHGATAVGRSVKLYLPIVE
jgi:hypothetical protein